MTWRFSIIYAGRCFFDAMRMARHFHDACVTRSLFREVQRRIRRIVGILGRLLGDLFGRADGACVLSSPPEEEKD
jgi:hypothetical protein